MGFLAIIFSFVVGDLLYWWYFDRRLRRTGLDRNSRRLRIVLAAFMVSQLGYLAWFLAFPKSARQVNAWIPSPWIAAVYLWHLFILPFTLLPLLFGLSVAGLIRGIHRVFRLIIAPQPTARLVATDAITPGSNHATLSRRRLLWSTAAFTPPLLAGGLSAYSMLQLRQFRIRQLTLAIPTLPQELDGLTIAHVSDTHIGRFTPAGQLDRIVEATNAFDADLVLFTGDLIDLSLTELDRGLAMVHRLRARHGVYLVEGNHDLIESRDEFERRTLASGAVLLIDQAISVPIGDQRVQMLGIRWGAATAQPRASSETSIRAAMARVLALRDPGAFPILLAHHPHAFDAAADAGLPLTLSGHTHGGQLMLNEHLGAGPAMFRYWSGLYRKQSSQLVVSNGVGNWFPLRINAPAEIVHLTLRCAR